MSYAFYYDIGSPYSYLAAERISGMFAEASLDQPEWKPVFAGGLLKQLGREPWGLGPDRDANMREVEGRAKSYGLPPIKWPDPFPANTVVAMRAAIFAKRAGRTVSYSLAAMRQAFAGGTDLSEPDNVLIAAAACELHPRAVSAGVKTQSVRQGLREATDAAAELGVIGVPTIQVDEELFWGDDRLEEALEAARAIQG